MSNDSSKERRKNPRVEGNIPLKISSDLGDIVAETKNISRSGAYCCVSKNIEPMTKLKVQLLVPIKKNEKTDTKKILCQGVVVRSEPILGEKNYEVAIFFNDITQKDAELISDYVSHVLENQSIS